MDNFTNTIINLTFCTGIPYNETKTPLVAVYSIVFAIGVPANCLTSVLTFVQILRHQVIAIYIFSLSLCELMYLSTLPLWIIYVNNGHQWHMGALACKITGFIFFCNIYISILLLCCISVDRYVALVYALESRGRRGQRSAVIIVCTVVAAVAAIHFPVFIIENGTSEDNLTCFEALPLNERLAIFCFLRFLLGHAIPFIILIFTNYKIFQCTKTSTSLTRHLKVRVKRLGIAIIVIFLICFSPYHVVLLVRAINFLLNRDSSCPFEKDIYSVFTGFLCFATANSIADPIIYVLITENIRKDFYMSLRRWRLNSGKLNSTIRHNNGIIKLKMSKESQEEGLREESKETLD
ncbi:putative G-protein coupled receptor 132 [Porphyrio hochstetteri]